MERREALKKTLLALGYTISVPSLISIFESCNNHPTEKWQPQFLSADQANIISELAETILPKTKTPGAKDINLDRFIDKMIAEVLSKDDQQSFLQGMDSFEKEAKEMNGKDFADSSQEQRNKLVTKIEEDLAKVPATTDVKKEGGAPAFYRKVKELSLLGYFTSKEIGKGVLFYNPVPGHFLADIPLTPGRKIAFE